MNLKQVSTKVVAAVTALGMVLSAAFTALPTAEGAHKGKVMFGYLYSWEGKSKAAMTSDFQKQVTATGDNLDVVSPNYFRLDDAQGLIKDYVDPEFVAWAKLQGIKVVPMLQNNSPADYVAMALSSPTTRTKIVTDLINLVQRYDLDGINIDIEGVTAWKDDKDLTAFTEELSVELHKLGKISSIAVMAKQGDNLPSWHQEYNYSKLGAAVDWLVIMAYDEHWKGGTPGPIASIGWVDKTLAYATTVMPKDKVILGVPFYGYKWSKKTSDTKWTGSAVVYSTIYNQAVQKQLDFGWDQTSKSPFLKYIEADTETQMWFENLQSLEEKTNLMHSYGLAGTAAWRIGQEPSDWWSTLATYLSGTVTPSPDPTPVPEPNPVPDPQPNPSPTPDPNPQPNPSPDPQPIISFKDMNTHWSKAEVSALVTKGIISGFPDCTFRPEQKTTRAQLARMIVKAKGLQSSTTTSGFKDVKNNHWAAQDIAAIKQAGIFTGFSDGTFKPEGYPTRAEVATWLGRAYQYKPSGSGLKFKDVSKGYWAESYIQALRDQQITNGYPGNYFKPTNLINRAEVSALILRCVNKQ